jgi:hypothetical protein
MLLQMRAFAALALLLLAFSSTEAWGGRGDWCFDPDLSTKPRISDLPSAGAAADPYSSFKGISLGSKSGDVAANSLKIGFTVYLTTFLNPRTAVASIDICRGDALVGKIDFDQKGQTLRLVLHAGYFYDRDISVRDFAKAVFEHYSVHPDATEDDACFQDVTCFRGRTDFREQFLILKIGGQVQLYVRRLRPSE